MLLVTMRLYRCGLLQGYSPPYGNASEDAW